MESASFVLRSALAVVFAASAFGKAMSMPAFMATLTELGLPAQLRRPIGWALVAAESSMAVLLVATVTVPAAIVGTLLVATFTGAAVRVQLSHQAVRCSCFGLSETVLGWQTLVRAALLGAMLAVSTALASHANGVWWPRNLETAVPSLALVAALLMAGRWLLATPRLVDLARSRGRSFGLGERV